MTVKVVRSGKTSQKAKAEFPSSVSDRETVLFPLVERYTSEALSILQKKLGRKRKLRCDLIELSGKLTSTMGYAHYTRKYDGRCFRYTYRMRISSTIFKEDHPILKETIFHEVAHLVDYQVYGQWGHGPTWCYLMSLLGLPAKVYATEDEYAALGYTVPKKMILGGSSRISSQTVSA